MEHNMMHHHKAILEKVRASHPLVHHITNSVTINDCANITVCIGASPVMAHAHEEVSDMVKIVNVLVLNIGTLDAYQVESMYIAAETAEECDIPIILDPVGAGATPYRTQVAKELISTFPIAVIKGNVGEIATLAGVEATVRGVDAGAFSGDPHFAAKDLAEREEVVVAITGETDVIADVRQTLLVKNGVKEMGSLSGTGCMAASLIGSCAAVTPDYIAAAATALCAFGIAGEYAAHSQKIVEEKTIMWAHNPLSYKIKLFDTLSNLTSDMLVEDGKIEIL
jgi:hydroxyethylthiazole kinase